MPKSYDFIEEIVQRRGKCSDSMRYQFASTELHRLRETLESTTNGNELVQLVPVRVVACMEGCLKAAAAELINRGDPYLQRARSLSGQVKLDFDILTALLGKRITVGEMLVHSLGWQSLASINSTMSTLLSADFFHGLSSAMDRWRTDEIEKPSIIVENLDRMLSVLAEVIRLRQVLCHEVAPFFQLSREKALEMLDCGWQFTHATNWLVSEILHPNAPLTQADMTNEAWNAARSADSELTTVLAQFIPKLDADDQTLLTESQNSWIHYREKFSELEGNAAKGGSLSPQLHGMAFTSITRARITELRNSILFKGWEAE